MVAKHAYFFSTGNFLFTSFIASCKEACLTHRCYSFFVSLGLIVTGGSDRLINVWDPEDSSSPVYTLVGHTDNVCSLFADTDGHIVSGSWDKYATIAVLGLPHCIAWSISSGAVS